MENKPADAQVAQDPLELVRQILTFIGEDPTREGLIDTPRRVVKSWKNFFSGYAEDPAAVLGTTFSAGTYDQMVICKDIEFYSTCEHHMVPFFGSVSIGYIPGARVVGLSKLARLVEVYARRLQIQEQMTEQIASTLAAVLSPRGVMVVVEGKHMCMCSRGVAKQNSSMITSSVKGCFVDAAARNEFLRLIK